VGGRPVSRPPTA